jgi:hypothetical protein
MTPFIYDVIAGLLHEKSNAKNAFIFSNDFKPVFMFFLLLLLFILCFLKYAVFV